MHGYMNPAQAWMDAAVTLSTISCLNPLYSVFATNPAENAVITL